MLVGVKGRGRGVRNVSQLGRWREVPHLEGRVALTQEEADTVVAAFKEAEAQILASPAAINERFRIAAMWKAREQGIE